MNRKQLTILLVLALVVGAAGWVLFNKKSESWTSSTTSGQKLFANFPLNDIAQVTIRDSAGELNLVKKGDVWRVKERAEYPANFEEISVLLRKVWELKVAQPMKVGPSQLGRLELLEPGKGEGSGRLLEFKSADGKVLQSLLLGKPHMKSGGNPMAGGGSYPDGRHIMIPGKVETASLVSEPFTSAETKAADWLNREFIKVEKIRSVSVTHTNAADSWKLSRETESGDWKLDAAQDTEKLDKAGAGAFSALFGSTSFDDVGTRSPLTSPVKVDIETFEGFGYAIEIAAGTAPETYAMQVSVKATISEQRTPAKDEKPEDKDKAEKEFKKHVDALKEKLKTEQAFQPWSYTVSKWTVEPVLKLRKDLMEKKPDPAAAPAAGAPAPGGLGDLIPKFDGK